MWVGGNPFSTVVVGVSGTGAQCWRVLPVCRQAAIPPVLSNCLQNSSIWWAVCRQVCSGKGNGRDHVVGSVEFHVQCSGGVQVVGRCVQVVRLLFGTAGACLAGQ